MMMKSEERRFHRLNYLTRSYMSDPREDALYDRAILMGVSESTARDYVRTVMIRARRMRS